MITYNMILITSQRGILMILYYDIYIFYMMTYMSVVILVLLVLYGDVYITTRPIWMDLGRGLIWA